MLQVPFLFIFWQEETNFALVKVVLKLLELMKIARRQLKQVGMKFLLSRFGSPGKVSPDSKLMETGKL